MEEEKTVSQNNHLSIVGVGASAGGLKAFESFLANLSANLNMAFVLIQHLDPYHDSQLAHLLQNHTMMQVTQVINETKVEPNCIYVIPPGKTLSISKGILYLSEPQQPRTQRAPIDLFFRSLAADQGENAICIILSGTGSDGALGLKNVKEQGGAVFAQEPTDAEYGGMPQSAIGTGLVDLVASAAELGSKLSEYQKTGDRIQVPQPEFIEDDDNALLKTIFTQLRNQTGHDFSHYKRSTISRRLQRRMQVNGIENLEIYLDFLYHNRGENLALFKDFLISVTNFFRDEEAFAALETDVITEILSGKRQEEQIRVWVPGCATGEEAYTLAILFMEALQKRQQTADIQIFATDLDDEALDFARRGLYPTAIATDVSSKRLKRFFTQETKGYRVAQELQEMVLFAPHNLIKDAPFARLDLISCRNLLIYLNRNVQRQVFEIFHYALRPDGYLFLGGSESADTVPELFRTVHKRYRIFQKRPGETNLPVLPMLSLLTPNNMSNPQTPRPNNSKSLNLGAIHRDLMLQRYAPPSVIVDASYQIRYKFGSVNQFLHHREGEPSHNILDNVNQEIRTELRTGLYHVFRHRESFPPRHVEMIIEDKLKRVKLIIEPLEGKTSLENAEEELALVIFESLADEDVNQMAKQSTGENGKALIIEQLEEEIKETRHRLQTTIEEYETSNEELKASNEELHSMNEELRSATEELETGREELRSTNEELASVNQELQSKVVEIGRAYSDLENLMEATHIPTLFLDRELRLKRYTPDATSIFNIIASDIGRPFDHISHKLYFDDLPTLVATVLRTLETVELKLSSKDRRWFLLRLRPYRTLEDRIDGVVLTLVEITTQVQAEQTERLHAQQQAIVAELGQLALLGTELQLLMDTAVHRIVEALHVDFAKVLELQPGIQELLLKSGVGWQEGLVGNAMIGTELNSQAGYTLRSEGPVIVHDLTTETRFRGPNLLTDHNVISGMSVIIQANEQPYGVVGVHTREKRHFTAQDVDFLQSVANVLGTAVIQQRANEERANLLARVQKERQLLESVIHQMPAGVIIADGSSGRLILGNSKVEEIWRRPFVGAESIVDYSDFYKGFHPDGTPYKSEEWPLARALTQGQTIQNEEIGFMRGDDSHGIMEVSAVPIFNQTGEVIAGVVVFEDITTRKKIEQTLKRYRDILGLCYDAIFVWRLDGGIQFWNQGAQNLYGYTAAEAIDQISQQLLQTIHPHSFEEIQEQLLTEGNWEGELQHVTKDGRQVTVSSRHQLLQDIGQGNLVLEINRDITDHKQVQLERENLLQELQLLASSLEERVEQRTEQIKTLASFLTIAEQRERERISHVLHDDLQQILHALQIRILIIKSKNGDAATIENGKPLEELKQLSDRALQITRSLTVELSPPLLTEDGLVEAFSWLVNHMEEIHGLQVNLIVEKKLALLNNNMRELVFQMVRELLFNIIKHADVKEATLKLWQSDGSSYIQVSDNGRGFDLHEIGDRPLVGYGLRSIRERIQLFGGSLDIQTIPDEGTTVTLRIPSE